LTVFFLSLKVLAETTTMKPLSRHHPNALLGPKAILFHPSTSITSPMCLAIVLYPAIVWRHLRCGKHHLFSSGGGMCPWNSVTSVFLPPLLHLWNYSRLPFSPASHQLLGLHPFSFPTIVQCVAASDSVTLDYICGHRTTATSHAAFVHQTVIAIHFLRCQRNSVFDSLAAER
jgi:hypothetical protein